MVRLVGEALGPGLLVAVLALSAFAFQVVQR
jgi:hypothetical protein